MLAFLMAFALSQPEYSGQVKSVYAEMGTALNVS